MSVEKKELESELSKTRRELIEAKTINEKIVSDLKREKQLLLARIKQFKSGMEQCKSLDDPNEHAEEEYEVEAILKHKETNDGGRYRIRWKGFDSFEDTWENEENLKYPKILNKYMRSNGLKRK